MQVHQLFTDPPRGHVVFTSSTVRQSSYLCLPQTKNAHGKVFGGYLMKKAYELAFMTAHTVTRRVPICLEVDDVFFRHPVATTYIPRTHATHPPLVRGGSRAQPYLYQVEIGSVLQLTSRIVHSDGYGPADVPRVSVSVRADVVNVAAGHTTETNTFEFIFTCKDPAPGAELQAVPVLVPKTYEEAMAFLAARRRLKQTKECLTASLTFDPELYL